MNKRQKNKNILKWHIIEINGHFSYSDERKKQRKLHEEMIRKLRKCKKCTYYDKPMIERFLNCFECEEK